MACMPQPEELPHESLSLTRADWEEVAYSVLGQ
jgi:hypothetical protein